MKIVDVKINGEKIGIETSDVVYDAIRNKAIEDTIRTIDDLILGTSWYHIHNGNLVAGANSQTQEPLYKYKDIREIIDKLKKEAKENNPDASFDD